MKNSLLILIIIPILLILFPSQVSAQDTISRSLTLPAATVTADKVTFYRDYKFVMIDFEIVNDRFYILQREKNSIKDYRILVTNMLYEPLDTMPLPSRFVPTNLELDIANNVQIATQDSMYQIVEIDNRIYYGFPSEKNHYRKVMQNCLFMTDRYVYFCETKIDGYLMKFSRINPKEKTNEIIFVNNDLQKYSEIPHEVLWHERHTAKIGDMWLGPSPEQWEVYLKTAWMRPEQAYLGHSHDTLYYFDHQNRKILTYDEDLNLLHSCEITYPDKETFWRHTMYQDRFSGKFYTVFGTTLNEIDVKTGKTIPKTSANNYLSLKMIIYKGNLYTLKRKRDSSNSEISYIEKTNLY